MSKKIAPKADYFIEQLLQSLNKAKFNATSSAILALLNQDDPKLYNLNLYNDNPDIQKVAHEQNSHRLVDGTILTLENLPQRCKIDEYVRHIYNTLVHLYLRLNSKNEPIYLISNKPSINTFKFYTRQHV